LASWIGKGLGSSNVDIILAGGSVGAEAAKHATSLIPIVAAGVGDLVELGLVTSLARPDGNLTGFVAAAPETAAKRFQIIKEIKPEARRAAVLWNSASSNAKLEWNVAKEFAAANDIVVALHDAHDVEELRNALASIPQSAPDVLVVLNDPFMFTYRKIVADAARQLGLPAVYGYREYVDDGGMISYGASITDTFRRAAGYVDKILRGAHPAELPIQLPTNFELVVNLKTAKALGLEIPSTLLARADEVIEWAVQGSVSLATLELVIIRPQDPAGRRVHQMHPRVHAGHTSSARRPLALVRPAPSSASQPWMLRPVLGQR
jgi:putative ABC transport system substrate-binding protein